MPSHLIAKDLTDFQILPLCLVSADHPFCAPDLPEVVDVDHTCLDCLGRATDPAALWVEPEDQPICGSCGEPVPIDQVCLLVESGPAFAKPYHEPCADMIQAAYELGKALMAQGVSHA